MSNWVETTAKTVDLAIEQALETLGVGVDDVIIEVIEEGEAGGLLGFGRKPARVRVSLADEEVSEQTMPSDEHLPLAAEIDEEDEPEEEDQDPLRCRYTGTRRCRTRLCAGDHAGIEYPRPYRLLHR